MLVGAPSSAQTTFCDQMNTASLKRHCLMFRCVFSDSRFHVGPSWFSPGYLCGEQLPRRPQLGGQTEAGGLPRAASDDLPPSRESSGDPQRTGTQRVLTGLLRDQCLINETSELSLSSFILVWRLKFWLCSFFSFIDKSKGLKGQFSPNSEQHR